MDWSVVVEEIQEVELRSFIYDGNYNRIELHPRSCTCVADFCEEVKTSVTQKEKSKGIFMGGYLEKYHFLLYLRILN